MKCAFGTSRSQREHMTWKGGPSKTQTLTRKSPLGSAAYQPENLLTGQTNELTACQPPPPALPVPLLYSPLFAGLSGGQSTS